MLEAVSPRRDKRQGSIIYDTLAPTAAELAQMHIVKTIFEEQSYLLTATGINLDNIAATWGIKRKNATYAVRIAETIGTDNEPLDLPIGSRFSTPNISGGLNYALTANTGIPGQCLLTCETPGTIGNAYLGAILPLFVINNLGAATIIDTYIPAEDTESNTELRNRTLARINQESYGGNVAQYREWTIDIDGVGDAKVFPVWGEGRYKPSDIYPPVGILDSVSGNPDAMSWISRVYELIISGYLALTGGPIVLSIIDDEYLPVTNTFIDIVQTIIDPVPNNGEGLGIVPIGHRVTVVTPLPVQINITATVNLKPGYTITQLQASVEAAIKLYLLEVRKEWAMSDSISIFIARISSTIIGIEGINNVANIAINGKYEDLTLSQSFTLQQVPILESVVLTNA